MVAHIEEERRGRLFEYRVFRIFGPQMDEVTGEWRKLRKEELNLLATDFFSSNFSTPCI